MAKSKSTFWNFVDDFKGDKVVWMITLLLFLISIVCMFSSTSRLLEPGETRLDIVKDQLFIVLLGLGFVILCYNIKNLNIFRFLSKWGFAFSLLLLLFLNLGPKQGPIRTLNINNAVRAIGIFGFQVHVFEVVKVAMVMYLSWAVEALKNDSFALINKLSELQHLGWLKSQTAKKLFSIYLPMILTCVLIMPGSNSSALFIGGIMFLTIVIGGGNLKDAMILCVMGGLALGCCFGVYKISGGHAMERIGTAISRAGAKTDYVEQYRNSPKGSSERQEALDKLRQPYGAKMAIKQGGFFGKGPGQSTQRYVVPDMPEDFMYSFIIEEYGLVGGIVIIILFVSLLARGSLIVRNCGNDLFAKAAVAGLTLLIVGQAFMHMFVNADFGLLTGQTLPLISHGNSAFICFSIAFGIILSISRIATRRIEKEQADAKPLMEMRDTIDDLENLDIDDL